MYLLMHSDSLHTINDTMMMMLHTNSWNTDGACNLRTHSSSAGSRCCTLSLIRVSTARSIIPLAKALCERSERIFGSLFFFLFYPLQLTSSSFWHSMHCADGPLCSSALSGTFTKFSRVYLTRSSGPAAVVGRLLRLYPQAVQTNILITTCNGHGWF